MVIKPKVRGFICTTAHPSGCAKHVQQQIQYVKNKPPIQGPKRVLVIGASTGYGLASRIVASFAFGAETLGVFFEKNASDKRTASAGWYNTAAFENAAKQAGIMSRSINGDAFSHDIKAQTIAAIQDSMGQVDLVIYSLATPRRIHPDTQQIYNSALKTTDAIYTEKSIEPLTGEMKTVSVLPGTEQEINDTIKVMGGEDWALWIDALLEAGVLADGAITLAYSYIGPKLTYPIYREGTIGLAKEHLEETAEILRKKLQSIHGKAFVSVNKAVVTQSSAAIPIVPLYMSILFKIMKQKGLHEGCIEQVYRLFERLYDYDAIVTDENHLIRLDDWEMQKDVQSEVSELWHQVNESNVMDLTDIEGYRKDFFNLFGFELANIDYEADVDPNVNIPSIEEKT